MVSVALSAELSLLIAHRFARSRLRLCRLLHTLPLHLLDLSEDHLIQPFVLRDLAHLMLLHKPNKTLELSLTSNLLFTDDNRLIGCTSPTSSLRLLPWCCCIGKSIRRFVSPYTTFLTSSPQRGVVIVERYGSTAERNVVASIAAVRVDRREVPESDRQLSVCWERAVVDRQRKPLTPYAAILEVLVRRLRVDGERLRIGERLDGDV